MTMIREVLSNTISHPVLPEYSMRALQLATGIICTVMCFSPMAIAADVTGAKQRLLSFGEFITSIAGVQAVPQVEGTVASPSTLPAIVPQGVV